MKKSVLVAPILVVVFFLSSCGFTVKPTVLLNVDDSFLYSYVLTSSLYGGIAQESKPGFAKEKRRHPNYPYNFPLNVQIKKATKKYRSISAVKGVYRFDSEDLVDSAVYKFKESLRETCVTVEKDQYRPIAPVCESSELKLEKSLVLDVTDYQAEIIFNEKLTRLKMTLSVTTGDGDTFQFSRDALPQKYPGLVGAELSFPDYAAKITLRYLGLLAVEALSSAEIKEYLGQGIDQTIPAQQMTIGSN